MDLEIQIQSLVFSFVFGMFFSLIYNMIYFILLCDNKIIKMISNTIYCLISTSTYFLLLYKINNGIIHPYFLLTLIIGFYIGNKDTKKRRIITKKTN